MAITGWVLDKSAAARVMIESWALSSPSSRVISSSARSASWSSSTRPDQPPTTTPASRCSSPASKLLPHQRTFSTARYASSRTWPVTTECGTAPLFRILLIAETALFHGLRSRPRRSRLRKNCRGSTAYRAPPGDLTLARTQWLQIALRNCIDPGRPDMARAECAAYGFRGARPTDARSSRSPERSNP